MASPSPPAKQSGSDSILTLSKHSTAALWLPKPKKTGNEAMDEQQKTTYESSVAIVDEIVRDPSCVQCLWNRLQERKRKALSLGPAFDGSATFSKSYPTLRRLVEEEPEWVALYLASASDLSPEEIVKTTNFDPESLHKLLHSDSGALRLTSDMLLKSVLWQVFTMCSIACGRKLKDLKTTGRWTDAAGVNFPAMCYTFKFKEGVLDEVVHRSTSVTVSVAHLRITADYSLQNPWSDLSAQFVKPPMAATKVCAFFKKSEGPLTHKDFMKPQEFKKILTAALEHVQEQADARNAAAGVMSSSSELVAELRNKKQLEQSEKMKRLRTKAQEELSRKAARTVYALSAAPSAASSAA